MIDPQAIAVLEELARRAAAQPEPKDAAEKLALAREMTAGIADFSGGAPRMAKVETIEAPGPRGAVPVRLYRPTEADRSPLLVWFHGGGAMAGSLDTHDTPLRQLAVATRWPIASVGYRMGPEYPYPAAHEDCWAATVYLANEADALGLDPARVVVGGDSIGGLFATTVSRLARDAGAPPLAGTVMLYPNTDLRPDRPHASLVAEEGNVMTRASMAYENDLYIPNIADRQTELASPLLARDLSGLRPTLLLVCEHDPLRDEGVAYGDRLAAAGVATETVRMEGMIHAAFQMAGRIDAANGVVLAVRRFLGGLDLFARQGDLRGLDFSGGSDRPAPASRAERGRR